MKIKVFLTILVISALCTAVSASNSKPNDHLPLPSHNDATPHINKQHPFSAPFPSFEEFTKNITEEHIREAQPNRPKQKPEQQVKKAKIANQYKLEDGIYYIENAIKVYATAGSIITPSGYHYEILGVSKTRLKLKPTKQYLPEEVDDIINKTGALLVKKK